MKKLFEEPTLSKEVLVVEDVITTSLCEQESDSCPVDAGEF